MKKYFLFALSAILLTGCNSTEPGAATAGKQLKLAFVTNNASDYWTIARRGVEKADAELDNVSVEFVMPPNGTAAEQQRIVDDLLAKGVDGLAISPVSPKDQTEMLNRAASQTLLITQDSDAPDSNRAFYVGTDNVAAGKLVGEELKKALPNGGQVMAFVGEKDAQNAIDRFSGIKQALEGSNIEVIDVRTDHKDPAKAVSNVSDTLVKYPDIAGLVGLWSYNGPAILNAVKAAKKEGQVKIVCFDEEDETLAGVTDGYIAATVVQQPYEFGYKAVNMMAKVKGGDNSVVPANKLLNIDAVVLHKEDVADYKAKLDKLRGH
jgi:ribose transport system substrate-binding protein